MDSAHSSPPRRTGPWTELQIREFLAEACIPMRLAANTDSGFPVILSLWSHLGRFLLARANEELVVRLRPTRIASWDYSRRMDEARRTIRAPK